MALQLHLQNKVTISLQVVVYRQPDKTWAIPIGDHSAQYADIYAYTHALKESMLVEGPILIVTDSAYLARSTVQDLSVWRSNSFLTTRRPLQHIAPWKQIDAYLQKKPDIEIVHEPAHRKLGSSTHTVGNQLADTLAQSVSQRYSVNVVTRSQQHTLSLNLDAELNACMDKTRPNPPGYPTKYSYWLEGVNCIVTIDDKNLIIPHVKEREMLALEAHTGLGQAHLGRDNVLTTLKQKYWWLNMKTVVYVIGNFKQCLLVNRPNHSVVPFIEKSIPKVPFELLYIDHNGPMPPSHGYKYVLVCVDACTRFTWLNPVRSATSNTTISSLTSLASIGKPRTIHSDGGPAFIAKETQNWATTFGLLWEISAPNHPQSSGVVERKNAEVKRLLTKLLVARPTQWYPLIPIVQMGINNIPNATNGKTPYEMLNGVPCNTSFTDNHISAPGRVEQLALLEEIRESFSRPTTQRTPPPAAWVPTVCQFVQGRVQTKRPLRPRWKKLVKIVTILNPRTFITENNQGQQRKVSIDHLKPAKHFQDAYRTTDSYTVDAVKEAKKTQKMKERPPGSQPHSRLNNDLTSKPVLMKTEEDEQTDGDIFTVIKEEILTENGRIWTVPKLCHEAKKKCRGGGTYWRPYPKPIIHKKQVIGHSQILILDSAVIAKDAGIRSETGQMLVKDTLDTHMKMIKEKTLPYDLLLDDYSKQPSYAEKMCYATFAQCYYVDFQTVRRWPENEIKADQCPRPGISQDGTQYREYLIDYLSTSQYKTQIFTYNSTYIGYWEGAEEEE
ncbi:LOW QUALITY PROTEIN: uncharacterized protein RCH25_018869 [Pelodytes ibericus]